MCECGAVRGFGSTAQRGCGCQLYGLVHRNAVVSSGRHWIAADRRNSGFGCLLHYLLERECAGRAVDSGRLPEQDQCGTGE